MEHKIYAKISYLVYYEDIQNYDGYKDLQSQGWELIRTSSHAGSNGYFGAAFKKGNEVVIAHRGTDGKEVLLQFAKDLDDDIALALGFIPEQYNIAKKFSDEVQSIAGSNVNIVQVGHSLGGALAQLISIAYSQQAVTFDAPGALKVAQALFTPLQIQSHKITSYLAAPNAINTLGEHITTPIWVKFDTLIGKYLNYLAYIEFTLDQHEIARIMKQFEPNSSSENNFILTPDWPSGLAAGYKAFVTTALKKAVEPVIIAASSKEEIVNNYGVEFLRIKTIGESLKPGPNQYITNVNRGIIDGYISGKFIIEPPVVIFPTDIEEPWNFMGNVINFMSLNDNEKIIKILELIKELDMPFAIELKEKPKYSKEDFPNYKNIKSSESFSIEKLLDIKSLPIKPYDINCPNMHKEYLAIIAKDVCKSPLYSAIERGNVEWVKTLLNIGTNPNEVGFDSPGVLEFPICLIIGNKIDSDLSLLKLFIEKGANLEYVRATRDTGFIESALFRALNIVYPYKNKQETIEILLKSGANPSESMKGYDYFMPSPDRYHITTLLDFAISFGGIEGPSNIHKYFGMGVQELINYGADIEIGCYYKDKNIHLTPLYKSLGTNVTTFEKILTAGGSLCKGSEKDGLVVQSVYTKLIENIDRYTDYVEILLQHDINLHEFTCL